LKVLYFQILKIHSGFIEHGHRDIDEIHVDSEPILRVLRS
jgi:hypothetical protein